MSETIEVRAESSAMRESWTSKVAKRFASTRRLSSDGPGNRSRRSSNDSRGSSGGGGGYQSEGNNSFGTRGSGNVVVSRPHSSASLGSLADSGGDDSQKNKRRDRWSRRTRRESDQPLSRARQMREKVRNSMDNAYLGGSSQLKSTSDHQTFQQSKSGGSSPMNRQVNVNVLSRFLTSTSKHTKPNLPESSGDSGDTCNKLTDEEPDFNNGADLQAVVGHFTPGGSSRGLTSSMSKNEGQRYRRRSNESVESVGPSGPKFLAPISKVSTTVLMSSRNLLASAVPVALRRNSSDGSVISIPSIGGTPRRSSNGSGAISPRQSVEELSYEAKQARLQKLGEDMAKCGELDLAIDIWKESLELAQENKDTLANRTEIMCVLMELHFQNSIEKRTTNNERDEEVPKRRSTMNSVHSMTTGSFHSAFSDDELGIQPKNRSSYYHERQAQRYVHRIKPAMVKSSWIRCSPGLLDFLSEAEAWELALIVAEKLINDAPPVPYGEPPVDPQHLATLHFQVASQKLESHKQGEALQHLQETVKCLQQVPRPKRNMTMYSQVLQLLASEYHQQGSSSLALEAYEELLDCTPTENQANICCQMAEIYINEGQLDMALEKLESAALKMDNKDQGSSGVIRLQLLQTKGDVLFRLGRMDASMLVYQQALQEAKNPADQAKLLYTMGRLCIRLRRTREAIYFFSRELEITKQELGSNHLSVSHIYHELAKLYDEGLGEQKMALMKYNKALQIELAVLQECHFGVATCQKCNPIAHRMCEMHSSMHTQVTNQIRETKKSQGRMHFKLGDFDKAVRTSLFNEQAPTGMAKRNSLSSRIR
ncbi:tetratricopeptide repeat protein [Nitzschia inconspicua]|uniref:Tetratricopeptide repeat protein n=1 Tax=Nitzschia inconspicua TaxID=303405 RepID=A0A9K3KDR5_9STRA|nr:tetratricopeptide repeat protein [Nitzschia inconspicua]